MNSNKKLIIFIIAILAVYISLIYSFYNTALNGVNSHQKGTIKQADLLYQNLLNTRDWNRKLGGLYIYEDKYFENPLLKDNSIRDKDGKKLIKINPAWMTVMLSNNLDNKNYTFRLVSNSPLNPLNKAKGFYKESLRDLLKKNTNKDIKKYRFIENTESLQYIQGIYFKKSCFECHAQKENKVGSIAGGLVIELNAKDYFTRVDEIWDEFFYISAIVTMIILLLIFVIYKFMKNTTKIEKLNLALEEKVKEKTRKLNNALKGANIGYWVWNIQTDEHTVDERWLNILGICQEDIENKKTDWSSRIHKEDLDTVTKMINNAILKEEPYEIEFRMKHKNGNYVWIEGAGSIVSYDKQGMPLELAGTHQDITTRKLLEMQEEKSSTYLNTLFDENPNIIIVTGRDGLLKANHAFLKFFNQYSSLEDFKKYHNCICEFFVDDKDDEIEHDYISNDKSQWVNEVFSKIEPIAKIKLLSKIYYFALYAHAIHENGEDLTIITFTDITSTYIMKKEFEYLSIADPVTKIYNRRYFNEVFVAEINRAARFDQSFIFLMINIDDFKVYNESYGHTKGDELLLNIATYLETYFKRSSEFVFRLSGHGFGVIYSGIEKNDSLNITQDLCEGVKNLEIENKQASRKKIVTISIGHFFADATHRFNSKSIYNKATKAMYYAAEHAKNCVCDYDEIK